MLEVAEAVRHPCLSYYGGTRTRSFPLMLVVGRAPNCAQDVDHNQAGPYHFITGQIAAFWSTSYSFAARHHPNAPHVTGRQFREECIGLNVSPLVYADALPRGVVNGNDVGAAAASLTQVEIEQHVDAVFSLHFDDLLARVGLVILSGLRTGVAKGSLQLGWAADRYQHHCRKRNVACAELPFFFGNNMPAIAREWTAMSAGQAALSNIMQKFP